MKAAVYERYGPPDVVKIKEVPMPVPGPDDILIKVVAATVSSGDWRARSLETPPGFGLITRLAFGVFKPRRKILGTELSGVVAAVGQNVSRFQPGDAVVAFPGLEMGSHAAFRIMPQDGKVLRKPPNLSFVQAAALCFGGTAALDFLRRRGAVKSGEAILIIGASGSVGSAAIQIAKHFGATVTAVCSASNADLVRSLGAEHVIDYATQDFADAGEIYDVVFDTVGASEISHAFRALKPGGRLLLSAAGIPQLLAMPLRNLTGNKRIISGVAREDREDLRFLCDLAEQGAFTPAIDRTYPLADITDAHAYVATGRKRGNVVIEMPETA